MALDFRSRSPLAHLCDQLVRGLDRHDLRPALLRLGAGLAAAGSGAFFLWRHRARRVSGSAADGQIVSGSRPSQPRPFDGYSWLRYNTQSS